MRWLALHFPHLALDLFCAEQIETNCTAQTARVILQDNRVCQANAAALQQGIQIGCTLATAHSICSTLLYKQRDVEAEKKRLTNLAQMLYQYSAQVSLQAPDIILLEVQGSVRLFGTEQNILTATQAVCKKLGFHCSGHIDQTPWAAIVLARYKAYLDANFCKSNSVNACIEEVPLDLIGLEQAEVHHSVLERLANMGIYTLGPVLKLPARSLNKRFGTALHSFILKLTGQQADPRTVITPPSQFAQSLHLLSPLRNKTHLHQHSFSPMSKLLKEFAQWLISQQMGCEKLVWEFSDCHNKVAMTVKFAKARQNLGDFMNISLLNLEQIELPDEIIDISLRSKTLTPWNTTTQNLFSNLGNSQSLCAHEGHGNGNGNGKRTGTGTGTGTGIDAEKELLIDELTARLGEGTCQHIYPADEHTPEQAFAISVNHANPQHKEKTNLDCAKHKRPLWLFDTPRPVVREQLQLLHGPERIQTAWWTEGQNMTCRDYYIAKHKMGMECWAFLDSDQQWYLHGYFG